MKHSRRWTGGAFLLLWAAVGLLTNGGQVGIGHHACGETPKAPRRGLWEQCRHDTGLRRQLGVFYPGSSAGMGLLAACRESVMAERHDRALERKTKVLVIAHTAGALENLIDLSLDMTRQTARQLGHGAATPAPTSTSTSMDKTTAIYSDSSIVRPRRNRCRDLRGAVHPVKLFAQAARIMEKLSTRGPAFGPRVDGKLVEWLW